MEQKYSKFFKSTLAMFLAVGISFLAIVGVVYASTTIGTNIDTDGTLVVDGNATTSGNLVVGSTSWGAPTSTLTVVGTAYFTGIATSSDGVWVGSAGSANNVNMLGGDLYVQNDAEVDGTLYLSGSLTLANGETIGNTTDVNVFINSKSVSLATSTATTTAGVWIGGPATTATSTLILGQGGSDGQTGTGPRGSCIEMWREGLAYRIYVNTAAGTLAVEPGRCKD